MRIAVGAAALLGGISALAIGAEAHAQTEGRQMAEVTEVVVTANRRAENVQDVPIAITAISAATADRMGLVDPQSLATAVPGLNWSRQSTSAAPFIRGVGSPSGTLGNEPGVATYVDDVYLPSNAGVQMGYANIERIEVLKGPQGTLFGRNATGGVINVYTRDPAQTAGWEARVGYATYQRASGSFYATAPFSDTAAANIFVYGAKQYDGWGKNLRTAKDTYLNWEYGIRGKVSFAPSDDTNVLLNVSFDKLSNTNGNYLQPVGATRSASGGVSPPGRYDTFLTDPYNHTWQAGASLKVTHDTDLVKIVSISSYRQTRSNFQFALDGAPFDNFVVVQDYKVKTAAQELRLISPDDDARLTWIVGGYLFYNDEANGPSYLYGAAFNGGNRAGTARITRYTFQKTHSYASFGQGTFAVTPSTNLTFGARYTVDKREARAFGYQPNGAYAVSPNSPRSAKWDAMTYRLSLDQKLTDDIMIYGAFNRGFRSGVFNTSVQPGALITDPVKPEDLDSFTAGFKSELLDRRLRVNLEAFHYKYKNLQVTQTVILPGVGGGPSVLVTQLTNAAAATIKGIDLEVVATPTSRLTLQAALSWMKGTYDDFPNGQFLVYRPTGGFCTFSGAGAGLCGSLAFPPNWYPATGTWNLKGNKTIYSPPFTMTLTGNYEIPTSAGPLDLTLAWFHSGKYYSDADNGLGMNYPGTPASTDLDRQKLFDVFSGSVSWSNAAETLKVTLWGKNITNEKYWEANQETGNHIWSVPAPPRTYGITLTARR